MLGVIGRKQECGERDRAAIKSHEGNREEGDRKGIERKTRKKGKS